MAKRPIESHEKSLKNQLEYIQTQRHRMECLVRDVAQLEADAARLRSQIQRAKRLGKDGFDRDKFQPEKGGA